MPPLMETIINPFVNQGVSPTPFTPVGQKAAPPVILSIGLKGGTKTFSTSGSSTASYKMGAINTESAPTSDALQGALGS